MVHDVKELGPELDAFFVFAQGETLIQARIPVAQTKISGAVTSQVTKRESGRDGEGIRVQVTHRLVSCTWTRSLRSARIIGSLGQRPLAYVGVVEGKVNV